ncbi:MAG: GNAT family N-acetyltransferase [Longicatena sp.]
MEIRPLNEKEYKHKEYEFIYETSGYYDLKINDMSFQFVYKPFEKNQRRSFKDELLADWLEAPVLYGAFVEDTLVGFIEGSMEAWNQRFRISNILVTEGHRGMRIGSILIEHILDIAKNQNARMVILETQSCNVPAIHCYQRNGFKIIGFDTHAYSNQDIERHEICIEMGIELHK